MSVSDDMSVTSSSTVEENSTDEECGTILTKRKKSEQTQTQDSSGGAENGGAEDRPTEVGKNKKLTQDEHEPCLHSVIFLLGTILIPILTLGYHIYSNKPAMSLLNQSAYDVLAEQHNGALQWGGILQAGKYDKNECISAWKVQAAGLTKFISQASRGLSSEQERQVTNCRDAALTIAEACPEWADILTPEMIELYDRLSEDTTNSTIQENEKDGAHIKNAEERRENLDRLFVVAASNLGIDHLIRARDISCAPVGEIIMTTQKVGFLEWFVKDILHMNAEPSAHLEL